METDSDVQQIFSSEEESCESSSREHETTFHGRKRKRSLTESSDTEESTCSNTRVKQKLESSVVANSSKEELKFPSFPSCSKVLRQFFICQITDVLIYIKKFQFIV